MEKKYVVAYGKTLSTKKGIFEAGEAVDADHFPTQEQFDELIEEGFIQEAAEYTKIKHYQGKVIETPKPAPVIAEAEPPSPEPPAPVPELKLGGAKKAKK
jgi:hypothetical protein